MNDMPPGCHAFAGSPTLEALAFDLFYWGRESMLTQADKFHQRIHDQGHVVFRRIKPGTRPRPIRWMIHEAAADRILVNVIDHRAKRGRLLDVAIISAASLPETIVDLSIGLGVPQTFEKRRCVAAHPPFGVRKTGGTQRLKPKRGKPRERGCGDYGRLETRRQSAGLDAARKTP
jgi:hypothetical protein